jgi:hypothetical protein
MWSPPRIAPPRFERGGLRGDDQETRQDAEPRPATQAEQTHNRHVTVMPQIHMADTRPVRVRAARGRAAVPSHQSRPLCGRSTPHRPTGRRGRRWAAAPTTAGLAQRLDQLAGGADEEAVGHRRAPNVAHAHLRIEKGTALMVTVSSSPFHAAAGAAALPSRPCESGRRRVPGPTGRPGPRWRRTSSVTDRHWRWRLSGSALRAPASRPIAPGRPCSSTSRSCWLSFRCRRFRAGLHRGRSGRPAEVAPRDALRYNYLDLTPLGRGADDKVPTRWPVCVITTSTTLPNSNARITDAAAANVGSSSATLRRGEVRPAEGADPKEVLPGRRPRSGGC